MALLDSMSELVGGPVGLDSVAAQHLSDRVESTTSALLNDLDSHHDPAIELLGQAPAEAKSTIGAILETPDTDPDATKALWEEVTSTAEVPYEHRWLTSRGRKHGGARRTGSESGKITPPVSASQSLFEPLELHATPESTVTNAISPRSPEFARLVLQPRRIFIVDTNRIVPSAFSHFRTPEPHEGETINYKEIPGLEAANIWVTLDDDAIKDIIAEYREMRGLKLCEEEFATFAKQIFLRGELRSRTVSEDRQWRVDRTLQLVCPPKESAHWRIPPLLDEIVADETDWTWDVRPDCAYWLSLKGFNPRYRFQIQNCAYVHDWITCPYFTVGFKRDDESEDVAVRRVCAAGALALFNRYYLYTEARRSGSVSTDTHIRHYTLTFVGHKFVFWVSTLR